MTAAATAERIAAENLRVAVEHVDGEKDLDLDGLMKLYTDDVVWEEPARGQVLRTHEDIRSAYLQLAASFQVHSRTVLRRLATDTWALDEAIWQATLLDDKLPGLNLPAGTKLSIRKLTLFEMRDGRICREINHIAYRPAGDPVLDHDDIPPSAFLA
ncbi:nuclear transport factor 2 family protein [Streptomyces sp. NPDC014870]|uniref:nuclear transport factor 2 family protein n=1 Tax=Streptomyces sp. NPDC014870 TaxID=3364925 RepID=UPI003700EF64